MAKKARRAPRVAAETIQLENGGNQGLYPIPERCERGEAQPKGEERWEGCEC
jgi:hypothetical protein